jgi:hypothetical protein
MALLPAGAYGTDVARPHVARSTGGAEEWTFNDPRAYAQLFDTLAGSRTRLEKAMGMSVPQAVSLVNAPFAHTPQTSAKLVDAVVRASDAHATQHAAALVAQNAHGSNPRKAIMLAFASAEHLERGRTPPCGGLPYIVMLDRPPPCKGLFPPFAHAHAWTLDCYVPGRSVLVYMSAAELEQESKHARDRVFVADADACAPLLTVCPVCAVYTGKPLKRCTACNWVVFCSAEHQRQYWPVHATVCGAYARLTGHATHPRISTPAAQADA